MIWIVRILMLFVFALYWGGLTFYTGFVVRISHDVLADPIDGGLITQRVTELLQYLGVTATILMFVNNWSVFRLSRAYGLALTACTTCLVLSLIGLFIVHGHLDAVIDIDVPEITDRDAFTIGHRRYNQLTTIEWIASVVYLPATLFAWRSVDRGQQSSGQKDS